MPSPYGKVVETTNVLPATTTPGVYGEKFGGENMRVYLDTREWYKLGRPESIEVVVRIPA